MPKPETGMENPGNMDFVTFCIGDGCYGIDVQAIQEVIKECRLTPVPLAPSYVKGVLNLRGQITTVIDLGERLGMHAGSRTEASCYIIAHNDGQPIGLRVDTLGEVLSARFCEMEALPANMNGVHRKYFQGVVKGNRPLVAILSLDAVLKIKESGEDRSEKENKPHSRAF